MSEINKIPFTLEEKKQIDRIHAFKERDQNITILKFKNQKGYNSGNKYKFAVLFDEEYYWLFHNQVVAKKREKAMIIFKQLEAIVSDDEKILLFKDY